MVSILRCSTRCDTPLTRDLEVINDLLVSRFSSWITWLYPLNWLRRSSHMPQAMMKAS